MLSRLQESFFDSFQVLFGNFAQFVGHFVVAVIFFIVGVVIANLAGKGIEQIVSLLKIDSLLRKADVEKYFQRAGVNLHTGKFFGFIVKWFLIILTLIQALSILRLEALTQFLAEVVMYLPNFAVAALILLAGIVIAEFCAKVVSSGVKASGMGKATLLGNITRWIIWIFTILSVLSQLGVGFIIQNVILGLVAGFSLAIGLAFGLGGKDAAAQIIAKWRNDIASHN